MASFEGNSLIGPLFDGTDLLAIVEELVDVGTVSRDTKQTDQLATQLILIDIAQSLRKIAGAPALHSYYRSKYADKYRPGGGL